MTTYFTPMLRGNGLNTREWYVEEVPYYNPLVKIHKLFGLVFSTFEECEDDCYSRIDKEGGQFVKALKKSGPKKGRRRGPYKLNPSIKKEFVTRGFYEDQAAF